MTHVTDRKVDKKSAGIGKGTPGPGRPPGMVNKATADVREAIAKFAQANVGHMTKWLNEIDDPAKRLDLYLRAIEYHIPKQARTELTGADGKPLEVGLVQPIVNLTVKAKR